MLKRWYPLVSAAALFVMSAGTGQAQVIGWGGVSPLGLGGGMYWQAEFGVYAGPAYDLTPSLYFLPSSVAWDPMTYVAYYPPLYSTRAPVAAPVSAPVATPLIVPAVSVLPESSGPEATVEVMAPADAVIRFDGHKTSQTGSHRVFATPPLPAGRTYFYLIEATFQQDGKPVTQQQRVEVSAGGHVPVVFPVTK